MEIQFLGTGAGVPAKNRNVSAIALSLLQELNSVWLFDCGEATQQQILHTTIRPRKINKVFITHLHGDHIFGLPGLLSSRSFQGGEDPLTIYGPKGIQRFIQTSLEISGTHVTYPIHFVTLKEGEILRNDKFKVYCFPLDHGIASYGFRIVERDKPGELLVHKLLELGIQPGPIYQRIKENETTTLENGEIIKREEVVGPDKKGRILSILGDTRYREEHIAHIKNSDVLIHEATFRQTEETLAKKYYHATTTQAARLAKQGNVKQLILTHISSRYLQKDLKILAKEARAIFPNTHVAKDFSTFEL